MYKGTMRTPVSIWLLNIGRKKNQCELCSRKSKVSVNWSPGVSTTEIIFISSFLVLCKIITKEKFSPKTQNSYFIFSFSFDFLSKILRVDYIT